MTVQEMVRQFHRTMGQPVAEYPDPLLPQADLRFDLIDEEVKELWDALYDDPQDESALVGAADALADIVYVCYGAALTWGIDLDAVIREVHRANMRKVWPDGKPRVTDAGKVLKPDGFVGPDVASVLGVKR